MRTIPFIFAGLVIAVLAISGCSSSTDAKGDTLPEFSESTSTLTSTTVPVPTATATAEPSSATTSNADLQPGDAELTGAVDAFWTLFLELGAIGRPFDPVATRARLAERTTGDEMLRLFDLLQGNALAGYVIRGGIDSSLEVVSVGPAAAEVRDCYDDTTGTYRIDTGERVDTDNPMRHQVLFTLTLEDGVWKATRVTGEGDGCVAAS